MTFDPIPRFRWLERIVQRPRPGMIGGPLYPTVERVLQVGYRPINGGPYTYSDVPVERENAPQADR